MSAAVSPSARQALGYCHVKWLEQTTALKSVLRVSQGGQCIPGAALVGGSGWNPFTPVIGATLSPPSPSEPMRCDQSKPFDTPSKVLSVGKLRGVIRTFFAQLFFRCGTFPHYLGSKRGLVWHIKCWIRNFCCICGIFSFLHLPKRLCSRHLSSN
jgi:hypothetical protein